MTCQALEDFSSSQWRGTSWRPICRRTSCYQRPSSDQRQWRSLQDRPNEGQCWRTDGDCPAAPRQRVCVSLRYPLTPTVAIWVQL